MAEQNSASSGVAKKQIGEYVVEIVGKNNENVYFPPMSELLRGRWESQKAMMNGDMGEIMRMPVLPGIYIRVEPRTKTCQLIDPLGLPENERLLDEASRIHENAVGLGQKLRPRPNFHKVFLNDADVVSWLYWMSSLVASGLAVKVKGSDVTLDDLKSAYPDLKFRRNFYDSVSQGKNLEPLAEVMA